MAGWKHSAGDQTPLLRSGASLIGREYLSVELQMAIRRAGFPFGGRPVRRAGWPMNRIGLPVFPAISPRQTRNRAIPSHHETV